MRDSKKGKLMHSVSVCPCLSETNCTHTFCMWLHCFDMSCSDLRLTTASSSSWGSSPTSLLTRKTCSWCDLGGSWCVNFTDNLPTYDTGQYDLTIHDLITIGPGQKSLTQWHAPQFLKTICEYGCHSLPSDVTVGFQPLLVWTLSILRTMILHDWFSRNAYAVLCGGAIV